MKSIKRSLLACAVAAVVAAPAHATNGYFSHGYGIKAKGMAGAGVALPQDAIAAATNPAGMVMVGDRMDIGVDWFRPIRKTEIVGNGALGTDVSYDASSQKNFFVPEFGYNRMINDTMSFGVTVYGNGGMNTDYTETIMLFSGSPNGPKAGVDLMQLFIAPTFAMKINDQHSIGISLNLARQRFKARGLDAFAGYSSSPNELTGNGFDSSNGWGVRIGWTGQITDTLTLGATYQTRTWMGEFDKYKGLFAEQGDFDIPSNYAIGAAFQATPEMTIALDVEWIKYSEIKSIANPLSNLTVSGNPLGADDGPGFGWEDMTVYKLGLSYDYSDDLTLRAGWNYGSQPIPASETFFNLLAPGVVEHHLTLGATWTLENGGELSVSYMHAFEKKVNGSGSIPSGAPFYGGEANLKMYQDALGIAYGWNF